MNSKIGLSFVLLPLLLLGACGGNITGLDAQSSFSCKAPDGVTCQSVSGVYANSIQGNLPSQQIRHDGDHPEEKQPTPLTKVATTDSANRRISPRDMTAPSTGVPVRQPPLILRICIFPYEDDTGDFYDQSYVYSMVNPGRWLVDVNRKNILKEFQPVTSRAMSHASPPAAVNQRVAEKMRSELPERKQQFPDLQSAR